MPESLQFVPLRPAATPSLQRVRCRALALRLGVLVLLVACALPLAGCADDHHSVVEKFLAAAASGDTATMKRCCTGEALAQIKSEEMAIVSLVRLEQGGYRLAEDEAALASDDDDDDAADSADRRRPRQTRGDDDPAAPPYEQAFSFKYQILAERSSINSDGALAFVTAELIRHGRPVTRRYTLVQADGGWKITTWEPGE